VDALFDDSAFFEPFVPYFDPASDGHRFRSRRICGSPPVMPTYKPTTVLPSTM
jgi:hypothetical protein